MWPSPLDSRGATKAANQKSDVVTVRFNFSGTDWQTVLFRRADGRVIRGTCVDAVRGSGWPLWGYYRCL